MSNILITGKDLTLEQIAAICRGHAKIELAEDCLLYTSPSPRDCKINLGCRLLLEKIFFNDTATTEIYT